MISAAAPEGARWRGVAGVVPPLMLAVASASAGLTPGRWPGALSPQTTADRQGLCSGSRAVYTFGHLRSSVYLGVQNMWRGCVQACTRTALGAVALASAGVAHAGGLFLPADAPDTVADVAGGAKAAVVGPSRAMVPGVLERRVRIARQELAAAQTDVQGFGTGRLLLNVREGVDLDVVVERTAPTKWGYSLSGRVVGGRVGFVTLVVHEEAVAGTIWTSESAYELHYLGGGVHALRDVTNSPPVECGGALPSGVPAADSTAQQGGTDDGSVVDILVVWTPEAEGTRGGQGMLSRAALYVAGANELFERGGALVSLRLVGAERVDYAEVYGDTDIRRLVSPNDGYMDGVHDRRNALGADLVFLATHAGSLGQLRGAFATGNVATFAHEVGHNFGIKHERDEYGTGRTDMRGGHNYGFTTSACRYTIMSYGIGCRGFDRTGLYASPWRYDPTDGRALGVSVYSKERGPRGPADAILTINRNRHVIANFRPSRNGDES